jgi:glycosyltransferase involved in cell wall biosynthesis
MTLDAAVVFGTYNRLPLLTKCVEAIRLAAGPLTYEIIAVDGGSTDGTQAYLAAQPDCICLPGDLSGAVPNFNRGFARAVADDARYIGTHNDDLEFVTPHALATAVLLMDGNPDIGAVSWASDHHRDAAGTRSFGFETWAGLPYLNQGLVRRATLQAVARFLGDPAGTAFWGNTHATYAADTEAGISIWRLGWTIHCAADLQVHDHECQDALKEKNRREYTTSELFGRRFPLGSGEYHRADAERCGGVLR